MNRLSQAVALAMAGTFCFVGSQTAKADEWNIKTVITISEPLQVPNKVLDPGKYVMKLLESPADRHIVQIFNADETKLITTVLAIPNYRLKPKGKSEFNYWEVPAGQPQALRAWFYPGDNFGQEFAYPPTMAGQLSQYNKSSMPTYSEAGDQDLKTAKLDQTVSELPPDTSATPAAAAPRAAPEAAPAPAPAAEAAPQRQTSSTPALGRSATPDRNTTSTQSELPHTASNTPAVGLIGLASLGFYLMLSARKRTVR